MWNHYNIEGFSLELLIGGFVGHASQMVLCITLYIKFQVELSERVPNGTFIKDSTRIQKGSLMGKILLRFELAPLFQRV